MALTNSQYDAIMHEYEERRSLHRQELEERLQSVYENVPGYKELEDRTATASVEFGKRLLRGEVLPKEDLAKELAQIAAQKQMLLVQAGYSRDFLDMGYTCPDCKDTGYIGNEKCHCFKQKIVDTLYNKSNLRTLTRQNNFRIMSRDYYKGDDLSRFNGAVKAAEDFINNFDSDYQNLFIYGTVGTGKSFLSICIADELLKKGHSVIYFSSTGLFELLGEVTFNRESRQDFQNVFGELLECELLIIDDMGTEMVNNFVLSKLFSLLNERDLRKKSTVITTNFALDQLQNTYSDRIFSRVTGNYKLLKISGPDIRRLKKLAKKESEDLK
ncbi:MAG: ATP-binding protein [Butyrivibrio sp.]|nr:ATP-binding protein [Butyrivibrio sp.]